MSSPSVTRMRYTSSAVRCSSRRFSKTSRIFIRGMVAFRPDCWRSFGDGINGILMSNFGYDSGFCTELFLLMHIDCTSLLAVCRRGKAGIALVCTSLLLSGCAVERYFLEYRVNVQQGNVVEQKNIVQLRPGMTRDQVRYVLGTPLLQDPFHANRWDYVYRYEDGASGDIAMRNIFVYFNAAGQLERVGGDVAADAAAAADLAQAVRSNEPQVIDLGSLPPDAEGPPEGSEPPSDSWWWRFIHLFK